jgi:hypothetical protein
MPRVARVSLAAQHEGDYMAAGSYNQPIDVHPGTHTVVAHQGVGRDITMEYLDMHRAFMAFRQIGHHLANRGWGWTGFTDDAVLELAYSTGALDAPVSRVSRCRTHGDESDDSAARAEARHA